MKYLIWLLLWSTLAAHAQEKKFSDLPQLPAGYWYSETEDKRNGTVVFYQNWYAWDGRQNIHWYQVVKVIPRPQPAPAKVAPAPVAQQVETPAVVATPETPAVAVPSGKDLEKPIEPRVEVPKVPRLTADRLRKFAPLVGEDYREGSLKVPQAVVAKAAPPALVELRPKAATSVRWDSDGHKLISEDRETVTALLQAMTTDAMRWQTDLLNRYTTCSDGKCIVRDRGVQRIEVPYQVGLGRVALLKQELHHLLFQVREENLSRREEIAQLVQLTRRLESLEGYLTLSEQGTASPYAERFREKIASLGKITKEWNIYDDELKMTRVLRWQLIALDTAVFLERSHRLEKLLPKIAKKQVQECSAVLKKILAKAGVAPWDETEPEQYELAVEIFIATAELKATYKAMASSADASINSGNSYGDHLALLGANENLSVYSYALVEELAPTEEIDTNNGGNNEKE